MKRTFLLLFLSVSLFGFAQSKFEVKHNGNVLKNNEVVEIRTVETIDAKLVMHFKVEVKNISDSQISMKMKKNLGTVMGNTSNTICWAECMGPDDISASSLDDFASGTVQTPYAEFELNAGGEAVDGLSVVYYTFQTTTKGDDPLIVEVHYKYEKPETPPVEPEEPETPPTEPEEPEAPPTEPEEPEAPSTGVEQVSNPNALTIYSANGYLTLNTAKPQTVHLYKMDGIRVRSLKLYAGTTVLADLQKGIYFINGQKIIIR